MVNSTTFYNNMSQMSVSFIRLTDAQKILLQTIAIICFCFFLYFISVILHVFFTTPHVRDKARYILFAHMLINDTLYLVQGLVLLVASFSFVNFPVPVCFVFVTFATASFTITPYNLAVMALERYVAICFPLRHIKLCTPQRSNYVITFIWIMGLAPNLADLVILSTSSEKTIFSMKVICSQEQLTVKAVQRLIRHYNILISMILVGLIIVFTYVRVMLIARNASSGSSSASKAGKTVMLHAFQFLLCLLSLTYAFFEEYYKYYSYLPTLNFILLTCLPRFLSPVIYGLRDKVFSKCFPKFAKYIMLN